MIRGAIFDADGTLLDSMGIWQDLGARYLSRLGKTPAADLSERLFPMTLEESSVYLRDQYHLTMTPAEIQQGILQVIADYYRQEVSLKPGVKEFLGQLRALDIPMAIATTGNRSLLEAALTRLEVRGNFQTILTCSELHTSKRQPDVYLAAAAFLGTAPGETLVFEDVLHALHTAAAAGFPTVAVEDAASEKDRPAIQAAAGYYLRDFRESEGLWTFLESL